MKRRLIILLVIVALVWGVNQVYIKASDGNAIGELKLKRGVIGEVLEEREVRDGEVVFYLRKDGERSPVLSADYINKSFLGWKWSSGGGHSLPEASEAWSYQYIAAAKGNFFNHSPFPLIFGTISNPGITAVTIKAVATGEAIQAEVVASKLNSGIKLWYAFITVEQGESFDLIGQSSTGEIVNQKHI